MGSPRCSGGRICPTHAGQPCPDLALYIPLAPIVAQAIRGFLLALVPYPRPDWPYRRNLAERRQVCPNAADPQRLLAQQADLWGNSIQIGSIGMAAAGVARCVAERGWGRSRASMRWPTAVLDEVRASMPGYY